MKHAYLMYDFPTQTQKERLDEMEAVWQMFEADILQSDFWHRYAMTPHNSSGQQTKGYGGNCPLLLYNLESFNRTSVSKSHKINARFKVVRANNTLWVQHALHY